MKYLAIITVTASLFVYLLFSAATNMAADLKKKNEERIEEVLNQK